MIIKNVLRTNFGEIILASVIGVAVLLIFYIFNPIYVAFSLLILIPIFGINRKLVNDQLLYLLAILIFVIAAFSQIPKLLLTDEIKALSLSIIPIGILWLHSLKQKSHMGMLVVGLLSYIQIHFTNQENATLLDGWISNIDSSPVLDSYILAALFVVISRQLAPQQQEEKIERLTFALILLSHASNYFFSVVAKLYVFRSFNPITWILENDTNLLVQHAVDQRISVVGEYFLLINQSWTDQLTVLLNTFVFAIQFGSLFVLMNRRLCILLFISYDVMHFGIFLLTGIFFWKWMILNLIFVHIIIKNKNQLLFDHYFAGRVPAKFIFLTISSFLFIAALYKTNFTIAFLGWHDTPLRYEVSVQLKNPDLEKVYDVPHAILLDYSLPAVQGMLYSSPNNPHPGLKNAGIFGAVSEIKDKDFAYNYCSENGTESSVSLFADAADAKVFTTQDKLSKIEEFISFTLHRLTGVIRENSYYAFFYPHHIFPSFTHIDFNLNSVCRAASSGQVLYGGASIRSVCVGKNKRNSEVFSQFTKNNIYQKLCER